VDVAFYIRSIGDDDCGGMYMNQQHGSIGIFLVYCIIILDVGLMNHVLVIPPLLQDAKRDAWLSGLGAIVPCLLWVCLLYYIMTRTKQQPLIPWLQQHYGSVVAWGFRLFFLVYVALISVLTLKETTTWTKVSYLPHTPTFVLTLSLVLLCLFAVHYGIRSIAISAGILLPFVVLFGDFVMSVNLPEKNYALLFPVMEHGLAPILKGSVYVGGGIAELMLILLLQHKLKAKIRLWSLWLLALFLIGLVMGPLTGAIAEFGPHVAAELRYPAFEEWRLVQIGKYISHVDFLSIYQWLAGAFIRISISIYILIELLPIQNQRKRTAWILMLGFLLVVAAELPISDMQYLQFLKHVYLPVSLTMVLFLSFFMSLLVLWAIRKGGAKDENRKLA